MFYDLIKSISYELKKLTWKQNSLKSCFSTLIKRQNHVQKLVIINLKTTF
jgi:hypothetical protein